MRGALAAYERLAADFPADPRLKGRLETLRDGLQPMELFHPKSAAEGPGAVSDTQLGEEAANLQDWPTAIAAYERARAADPTNELVKERLGELRKMAAPAGESGLTALAEPLGGSAASAPPEAPPPDPTAVLQGLLERVRQRRRRLE